MIKLEHVDKQSSSSFLLFAILKNRTRPVRLRQPPGVFCFFLWQSHLKSTLDRVRKSIQRSCLEFTQEKHLSTA